MDVQRGRDGLTLLAPRLFVSFYGVGDEIVRQDEAPWEPELEAWLIDEERARATTVENEMDRFSLLLKPAFRPILVRYGDGYFNSVLVASLREGPYGSDGEVADVLRAIHEDRPAGGSRADCEQMIDHELGLAAKRLLVLYDGNVTVAAKILGGAIARYLDERFSVTNSRMLGLI